MARHTLGEVRKQRSRGYLTSTYVIARERISMYARLYVLRVLHYTYIASLTVPPSFLLSTCQQLRGGRNGLHISAFFCALSPPPGHRGRQDPGIDKMLHVRNVTFPEEGERKRTISSSTFLLGRSAVSELVHNGVRYRRPKGNAEIPFYYALDPAMYTMFGFMQIPYHTPPNAKIFLYLVCRYFFQYAHQCNADSWP